MKVQIEIEIPDGHEIVDMEVLADEYPRHCSDSGKLLLIKTKAANPFLVINGVPSDWPEWLTASYIAKDEDGKVWAYHLKPSTSATGWYENTIGGDCLDGVNAIDIPGPWEQSLRENPRRIK